MGVSRHWRYSREVMAGLIAEGRVVQTRPGAVPQMKRFLDEMPGVPLQELWADVPIINNRSKESLGYPTQKPLALLKRIILASSNEGDVVLDPFGGSGTTYAVAERMHRHWIGVELGDCDPILRRLSGREPDVTPPRRGDAAKGMQRPGVTPPLRRDAAKGTHRGDT